MTTCLIELTASEYEYVQRHPVRRAFFQLLFIRPDMTGHIIEKRIIINDTKKI